MAFEENMLARTGGYLEHFGIKGQKWGVRRFQNPDGTLTEAGKQHYSISTGGNEKLGKKFKKENKKLAKWTDRADQNAQSQKALEYYDKARQAKIARNSSLLLTLPAAGAVSKVTNGSRKAAGAAIGVGDVALIASGIAYSHNKRKFKTAKKYSSDKGHAEAVERRRVQYDKMMNTFAGTPYADLLKKQE